MRIYRRYDDTKTRSVRIRNQSEPEGRNRIVRNAGHAAVLNLPADTDLRASIDSLMSGLNWILET